MSKDVTEFNAAKETDVIFRVHMGDQIRKIVNSDHRP